MGDRRGIALVMVLWVLLALIAASFARTTRTEVKLARNITESAKAEALADASSPHPRSPATATSPSIKIEW